MKRWRAILAHAFAVEKPGPAKPTRAEAAVVDRVLHEVIRRRMTTPATIFLESVRPMTYLGSQAMHFFGPFMTVLIEPASYRAFSSFLERRGAVDYLLLRMDEIDRGAGDEPGKEPSAPAE